MGFLLESHTRFVVFGPSHLVVLALSLILGLGLVWWARGRSDGPSTRLVCWLLGLTIFAGETAFALYPVYEGNWSATWSLPLQLCDVVAFLALPALVTRNQYLVELLYFWGFTGTLLAAVTPELGYDFPHIEFFCFFASHTLVVVAAGFLVFGLGVRPKRGGLLRVFLSIQAYGLITGALNSYLGSNYLFLNRKPYVASPFDYLGPWPIYVVAVDVIFLVLMCLLSLPFRRDDENEGKVEGGEGDR